MEALNLRSEIPSLIKSVSEEHGMENYFISDVQTNQKGEGYMAQIFLISVKDRNNDKQLNMVIKATFDNEKIRETVPIRMSFQNETVFYNNIYPTFKDLERGITTEYRDLVPKCFRSSMEEKKELLILENLKAAGFEHVDKSWIFDEEHVKVILETYGRFHAYSFTLQDQKPEVYDKLAKNCLNVNEEFMKSRILVQFLLDADRLVEDLLIPGEDDEIIEKYKKYAGSKMIDIINDIITKECDYSAILHGDGWSNNMMFKYEDTSTGKKLIDMRLIDWQMLMIGSPVCDLSYCLYSGASKEVFDNLDDFLQIYYHSLSSTMKELGSDPEKLFPMSVLKDHWKKYAKFGMIMALYLLKIKLTYEDDIIDVSDDIDMKKFIDMLAKQKFDEANYKKRIRVLLWHMSKIDAL